MKNLRKPSIPHFGPRSNVSPRLKMAHGSRVRSIRKGMNRFVSSRMKKIHEEVKKGLNNMRTNGAANQVFVVQRAEQSVPKVGNTLLSVTIKTNEHLAPLPTSTGKSNCSPSVSQHINKNLNTKIDSHSNDPGIVKDKDGSLSPFDKSNGTLRPLELYHKEKTNQGLFRNSNWIKGSYSQANHLKAMPGLVHQRKTGQPLDQGAAKGMHSGSGRDGFIGGMEEKNTKYESLPGAKIRSNTYHNKLNKRRIYRETNSDDDAARDHQNDEDDSTRNAKISSSFVSKCIVEQHDSSLKPIDESAWSGILKVDGRDYVLAGHLSTKSGEKVWNLTKSLRRVVDATKVRRLEVWPKRWETSRPTNSESIGLYFFPYKMRPDKSYDQLITEVTENDLAIRLTIDIDEAEMLIFSSILLPEQYQTFQSKHYLWGVFRPRSFKWKYGNGSRCVDNNAKAASNATTSVPIHTTVAANNVGAVPTEALKLPTKDKVVSFVVRQTPRVEKLIQEMEREGVLVAAMQGEMLLGNGSLSRCHGSTVEQVGEAA